jgi:hypothetical protein
VAFDRSAPSEYPNRRHLHSPIRRRGPRRA